MAFETSFGLESHCKSDCSCLMAKSSNVAVACGDSVLGFCTYVMWSSRSFSCASLLFCSRSFCGVDLYWLAHAEMTVMIRVELSDEPSKKEEEKMSLD